MVSSASAAKAVIRFGIFEFDPQANELRRNGSKVKVEGQPLTILGKLLERPGQIVTREELKNALWQRQAFGDFEHSINVAVKRLREAIDDSAETPRYIQTLPKRGYRFIYPIDGAPALSEPKIKFSWRVAVIAAMGVLIVAILSFALFVIRSRDRASTAAPKISSIAVLPLKNLSGDPAQEYFADGMTDALITELGKIGTLRVISLQSVLRYKKTNKSVPEIAHELKVNAVIEGSVLRTPGQIRIDAQLVEAEPERHLWAESFVQSESDVLKLQKEVAVQVAHATQTIVGPPPISVAENRQVNPAAYQAYLHGRELYQRFDDDWFDQAAQFLNKAIEFDPSYAPPYATLAEIYSTDMRYSYADLNDRATAAAAKALHLDSYLPDAHAAQAYVNLRFRWDWAGAEREIKRALELNPNSSEALQMYGLYLILMARYDEGIAAYRRALELDPLNFLIDNRLGWAYSKAGRLDESITHLGNLARLNPEKLMAHYNLAHAYAFKGMYDEAMQHVRIGQRNLVDTASTANFDYAWVIAVSGHRKEAEDLIKAMLIYRRHHYLDPMTLALAYVGLGENEKALQWLEEGYKQHARFMIFLKSLHQFDGLRFDPRFRDLMRQMNFPAE